MRKLNQYERHDHNHGSGRMIELILFLIAFTVNRKNAIIRRRHPTKYLLITAFSLVVGWMCGFLVGYFLYIKKLANVFIFTYVNIYVFAYACAVIGCLIGMLVAYLVAKHGQHGDYRPVYARAPDGARRLDSPCSVSIIRDKSTAGADVTYTFYLNGKKVGKLGNDQYIVTDTMIDKNIIYAEGSQGSNAQPYCFLIEGSAAGQMCEIHFRGTAFRPQDSVGVISQQMPKDKFFDTKRI